MSIFLRVLWTGEPWRAVTAMSFQTAHSHFLRWARGGVFQLAYRRLHRLARRPRRDAADVLAMDTSFVKSIYGQETIGRNPTDRGRMGTKVFALVDAKGLPEFLAFFGANVSDHTALRRSLPRLRPRHRAVVYGDRGFDSQRARAALRARGYAPLIARRGTADTGAAPRRVVERFFSWLDKSRRLIVRYDATIAAYAGWTWLACCRLAAARAAKK